MVKPNTEDAWEIVRDDLREAVERAVKIAWHEGWDQGYIDHRDGNV